MFELVPSGAESKNPKFEWKKRRADEDNIAWLQRVAPKKTNQEAWIILLGGAAQTAFRLRVAQSYARHDLTPSHWSDVVWVNTPGKISPRSNIAQISLKSHRRLRFSTDDKWGTAEQTECLSSCRRIPEYRSTEGSSSK